MSASRTTRRRIERNRSATAGLSLEGAVLTEERGIVRHTCGHAVFWELLPGVPDDFLRAVSLAACPCCGGETGLVSGPIEWPDHALFAGVGLAHCHEAIYPCEAVNRAHRIGRHLRARRG